ncbi:hypothetical protein CXIVA_17550 [Clostridium sp. SY8519]|jgi:hypothetical protein|uniref:hypothetical protein n=1 Tax=Clostridium sp. (strain SY8519) TaxID=1042156 RepID=UPI0002171D94|nr:hypothetical protein [Clostridium sp. SY8519]BAK47721.1 hypothetical protein CXIVA_17550 [Clostridium sp. SY8519]
MVYRQIPSEENNSLRYQVWDGPREAAAFSCVLHEAGGCDIQDLTLQPEYDTYENLDRILEFIRYKALVCAKDAVYVRLDARNYTRLEQFKKFGFYQIDQYITYGNYGQESCVCVLKYLLR